MNSKRLKTFGLIALIVAFTFTMAACDMGSDDTGLDDDVDETGELIVTADMGEVDLQTAGTQDEVGAMSTPEERFEDYELEIKITHETGRVKTYTDDEWEIPEDQEETKEPAEFDNIITGDWDITVTLDADYNDTTYTIATGEADVDVSAGETNTAEVTVFQEEGALELEAGEDLGELDNLDYLELHKSLDDIDNDPVKDYFDDDGDLWEELPARQYVIYAEVTEDEKTYDQKRSIMVLPGVTKDVTVEVYEGSLEIDIEYDFPPEAPDANMTADGLEWDEVEEADSYNVVRKEEKGRVDWEFIEEGIERDNDDYPFVDDDAVPGREYKYAVVAVNEREEEDLTSDYSDAVANEVTVENEDELNDALDKAMFRTIIVAEGETIEVSTGDGHGIKIGRDEVTLKAENNNNAIIDAQGEARAIDLDADSVRIEGFTITGFTQYAIFTGDHLGVNANDFEIVNNTVEDISGTSDNAMAIDIQNANGGLIKGNVLYAQSDHSDSRALQLAWTEDIDVVDNRIDSSASGNGLITLASGTTITDNTFNGEVGDLAVSDSDGDDYDLETVINNNTFDHNAMGVDDQIIMEDSINDAIDAADERVLVGPEEYEGEFEVDTDDLSIVSVNGADETTIEGKIDLNADDVKLEGFTVDGEDTGGSVISSSSGNPGTTLKNNVIKNGFRGKHIDSKDYHIEGNVFEGLATGIGAAGNEGWEGVIQENDFKNMREEDEDEVKHEAVGISSDTDADDFTFENNYFEENNEVRHIHSWLDKEDYMEDIIDNNDFEADVEVIESDDGGEWMVVDEGYND